MSGKNSYSADEWQLLMDVPMMVGAVVMVVGKSGLGTTKESFAMAQESLGAVKHFPDNALIQAIVQERLKEGQRSSIESLDNPMLRLQPEAFKEAVLAKCAEANTLLAAKAGAEEAREYRQWVMQIADRVAHAASEGGILGFGGAQFSEPEKLAIGQIQSALGVGLASAGGSPQRVP